MNLLPVLVAMSLAAATGNQGAAQPITAPAPPREHATFAAGQISRIDPPCREGHDDRSSDLCAQWKAADAAKSSAQAAWWLGTIGALIGALTLGAAAAAALFAKKAAVHTEETAVATIAMQRYALYETAPWIWVEFQGQPGQAQITREGNFTCGFSLRNRGKSEAMNLSWAVSMERDVAGELRTLSPNTGISQGSSHNLKGGMEGGYGIWVEHPIAEVRRSLGDDFEPNREDWRLIVDFTYDDLFNNSWEGRETFKQSEGWFVGAGGAYQRLTKRRLDKQLGH